MRALAGVCLLLCVVVVLPSKARADLKKTIDLALENYDLGEYGAAKLQLEGALASEKGDTAQIARAHLVLGAVYVKLGNEAGAKASFSRALDADESVRPDDRLSDSAVRALFEHTMAERAAAQSCDGIAAIAHDRGQPATAGKPYAVSCLAGTALGAASVQVFYRTDSDADYSVLEMKKTGECKWTAEIPAVSGEQLEYRFSAVNEAGKALAGHGTPASPISVVIEAAAEAPPKGRRAEDEVPDELGGKPAKPRGNGCAGCSGTGAGGPAVLVMVACALLAARPRNRFSR